MAQQTSIVLVCDLCGKEGTMVDTHAVTVDKAAVEAEACDSCWGKAVESLMPLATAGRAIKGKRRPRLSR